MPFTLPKSDKPETIAQFVDRTSMVAFRRKAIGLSALTIAGAAAWIYLRRVIPFKVGFVIVGYCAVAAARNIQLWREWYAAHPGEQLVNPDRIKEEQQETVRIMYEAVKTHAYFTWLIIGCVAAPSLLQALTGGVERSLYLASVDPVAIRAGQYWRLLSGTYLHGSYYHFIGNMSALLLYGAILESKTSRLRLPFVYLVSCLAGSLASVQIPPDVVSIGASGGVVGVIAYLFLFSGRQRWKFPPAFHGATVSVFTGLLLAGALGFWYIDNPGHAGGALAGLCVAALTVDTARNYDKEVEHLFFDLLGWLSVAVLVAGSVFTSLVLSAH